MSEKNSQEKIQYKNSHSQRLSVDAEIIWALRKQPKTIDELVNKNSKITRSSFYRKLPLLNNQGIIKKIGDKYALSDYVEKPNLWNEIKSNLEYLGAKLVDIKVKKASNNGTDPITGWFKWRYDSEYFIKGILVLRNAPQVVAKAQEFEIYLRDDEGTEYAGVVLTKDLIGWMDRIFWDTKLYYVRNFEDRNDGYDFSYRIGYLTWLPK